MLLLAQAPAPAAPVLTPAAALISAAALILVALVTTGVQIYIARRNWEEQAKQAGEDREDQRKRDHEARRQENRHRFAERRQEVYVQLLKVLQEFADSITEVRNIRRLMTAEEQTQVGQALAGTGRIEKVDDMLAAIIEIVDLLQILAPQQVRKEVERVLQVCRDLVPAAFCTADLGDTIGLLMQLNSGRRELVRAMRVDLDGL